MGSGQSSVSKFPNSSSNSPSPSADTISTHENDPNRQQQIEATPELAPSETQSIISKSKKQKKESLTSFDQIEERCAKKKVAYEKCYNLWWRNSFTAAKLEVSRDDCDSLFERYQNCYLRGVKQVQRRQKEGAGAADGESLDSKG